MSANSANSANLERLTEFQRNLADKISRKLQAEVDIPPPVAANMGTLWAQEVCDENAGQLIYIPTSLFRSRISKRDRELFAFYLKSGKNIDATCAKFRMSMQNAYRRIAIVDAEDYAKRQGTLAV